jgi:hypothetical protein
MAKRPSPPAMLTLLAFVTFGCASTPGARDGGASDATGAAGASGAAGMHLTDDGFMGGGNPGSGTQSRSGFVGAWLYDAGTTTRKCPGQSGANAPPDGALSIAAGASATELIVTEPGACSLRFTLAGRTATAVAGQTCGGPDGAGGRITFDKLTWKLTLSADAQTLAESLTADEILAPATGSARTCAYTETGVTLRRQ